MILWKFIDNTFNDRTLLDLLKCRKIKHYETSHIGYLNKLSMLAELSVVATPVSDEQEWVYTYRFQNFSSSYLKIKAYVAPHWISL